MSNKISRITKEIFLIILAVSLACILNKKNILFLNMPLGLILVIISLILLLFLQIPNKKEKTIFFYNRKLHSLIETKYGFLTIGHIFLKLFLIMFSIAYLIFNLLSIKGVL